jgi:hypothetical protein
LSNLDSWFLYWLLLTSQLGRKGVDSLLREWIAVAEIGERLALLDVLKMLLEILIEVEGNRGRLDELASLWAF